MNLFKIFDNNEFVKCLNWGCQTKWYFPYYSTATPTEKFDRQCDNYERRVLELLYVNETNQIPIHAKYVGPNRAYAKCPVGKNPTEFEQKFEYGLANTRNTATRREIIVNHLAFLRQERKRKKKMLTRKFACFHGCSNNKDNADHMHWILSSVIWLVVFTTSMIFIDAFFIQVIVIYTTICIVIVNYCLYIYQCETNQRKTLCFPCKTSGFVKDLDVIIAVIYGPLIHTFYLIIKHGIQAFLLRFKQFQFVLTTFKQDLNDKTKCKDIEASMKGYYKYITKNATNNIESRQLIVIQLLKSFVAIFESFPQLLLQCYVYFIVRQSYKTETSYVVIVQFSISIAFSLFSTLRSVWRLLTHDLFQRGLKQAFDFAAVKSILSIGL